MSNVKDTPGDWIFKLGLTFAIFFQLLDVFLNWNNKAILEKDIILEGLTALSGLLILIFHMQYRWQTTIIIGFTLLFFCKFLKLLHKWYILKKKRK